MKRSTLAILAGSILAGTAGAAEPPAASVRSTLATGSRQIRQFAFDGDAATFFESAGNPTKADHFTLAFDRPVAPGSVAATSGKPDGANRLDGGILEVSADGQAFEEVARFAAGSARAEVRGRPVLAVRIRPASDMDHPLAIREIALEAAEPVPTFAYPVEFAVDVTQAPEMKEWADRAAGLCERWYPKICDAFRSEGYRPASQVTMVLSPAYKGVAMAGGSRITGSVKYFQAHPDDLGAMIHETVHVVQRYRSRKNPSWLSEGVADYYRFFVFEPGQAGPVNPARARYNDSYRTSATFLAYLTEKYDPEIVPKLNRLMREGRYGEDTFRDLTGKPVAELGEEWLASLRK